MDSFANEVYNKTTRILQDKKEYLAYIRAEQAELDHKGQLRYAKEKGKEEGKKEGKEEGKKEGKEEGEEIGLKRGRLEEKLKIAINLKKLNLPYEQITEATGIPITKIKEL